ncbi:nuclear transport factor 2 family protein [Variovorax rhizosphaerae]|uniref:Nuclear transport factor 2 family protein n=1 Tax=Variovorax rhizosphaerae TaxID=1836200 RepID=A0ABU8WLN2_9BURK
MCAAENKDIVLAMYRALNSGDRAGYYARWHDDVEVTYFGSHHLARTYHGKKDFLDNFVPALRARLDGTIKLDIHNVVAEGDQVVVEGRGTSQTKDGLPYNNTYCIVLKLRDGLIVQIREYMDTELTKSIFG